MNSRIVTSKTARFRLLGFLLAALDIPALGGAQEGIKVIETDEVVSDWILDEATGRIFAAFIERDLVAELDEDGKVVREFKVGGKPTELLIKKRRLAVACGAAKSIAAIDLEKNAALGSVTLEGDKLRSLFSSDLPDDLVYVLCGSEVFEVNLAKLSARKPKSPQPQGGYHRVGELAHVVLSSDGRWAVGDGRGYWGPSGADLFEVDDLNFRGVLHHHNDYGPMRRGPGGRFWTLGQDLYPLDLSKPLRRFAGPVVAFHPDLDLVAALTSQRMMSGAELSVPTKLTFQTFSDAKELATIDLPQEEPSGPGRKGRKKSRETSGDGSRGQDPTLQFDSRGERIFVAQGQRAYLVGLKEVNLPRKPLVLLKIPTVVEVQTGEKLRVPLALTNAAVQKEAEFSLAAGPEGARVEKDALVWAPRSEDVGENEITITAKVGDAADTATLKAAVVRPRIALDWQPNGIALDSSSRRAAVYRSSTAPYMPQPQEGDSRLALVDIEARNVLARYRIAKGIAAVHIDDRGVYLAPAQGTLFYRLKLADLSTEKRVFTDAPVRGFQSLPANKLAVLTEKGRLLFDAADLKPLPQPTSQDERLNPFYRGEREAAPAQLRGGLIAGQGKILDGATGKPCLILTDNNLWRIVDPSRSRQQMPPEFASQGSAVLPWNRRINGTALCDAKGNMIAQLKSDRAVLLPDQPAVAALMIQDPSGERSQWKVGIEFRDLIEGSTVASLVVFQGYLPTTDPNRSSYDARQMALFRMAGDKALVTFGPHIYIVPLPKEKLSELPEPLSLEPRQSLIEAPVEQAVKVSIAAKGGKGKLTYELREEHEGLDIDAGSGEVRADLPALWKAFKERLERQGSGSRRTPMDFPLSFEQARQQMDTSAAEYARLLDQPPPEGMCPLSLPLRMSVRDEEGQQADLDATLIVLAPRAELTKKIEAAAPKVTRPVPAAPEKMGPEKTGPEKIAPEKISPQPAADDKRLSEIEARIRKLELIIDALSQKLERIEKAVEGKKE